MDTDNLGFDLQLDEADLPPPPPETDEPPRRPEAPPPPRAFKNSHLVTFVVVLFGALELQAILVLMGTADGAGAEATVWAFGGVFMLSTFAWFFGGMLWFNRQWEREH